MKPVLAAERVSAQGRAPSTWIYVLHGVYGMGRNWASVMRRLVEERPELGAVLVDLRMHGASQGFAPPHTLEAAARDLVELEGALAVPADVVMGHSFGGKVALQRARMAEGSLRQVWVVDSTPSAREPSGSAWEMLERLRSLRGPFESRDEVVGALEDQGISTMIARWMATNLERGEDGLRWRFDFEAVEALLRDFFRQDLWDVVEDPPAGVEVHLVKAEESSVLPEADAARIDAAAEAHGRAWLHRIGGGHWVNAENPDALLALLRERV